MTIASFFDKLASNAKTLFKEGETDVEKLFADVEPAAMSFLRTVSHDFIATWMPEALQIVTNLLTSGQQLSTATISAAALELEQTALKDGGQVLTQDALTTIQMAVAHVKAASAAIPASAL